MKKAQKNPFRRLKNISRKDFVTAILKLEKKHILVIPEEIVKAFQVQIGDIAIYESSDKNIKIKFVIKSMYSFVEKTNIEKLLKNKKIKVSFLSANVENDAIIFGKKG